MVQFAGTYKLMECVNPEELLKATGKTITGEKLKALENAESTLTVTQDGDNYNFTTNIGDAWTREIKFTLGQSFEESVGGSPPAKTTVTKDGNKLTFISVSSGKSTQRVYEFSDSEAMMVFDSGSGKQAKRIYKRI